MRIQDSSHTKTLQFLAFVIASIALLAADHKQKIPEARTGLSIAVYPLKVLVDLPYTMTKTVTDFFKSHKRLTDENKELRRLVTIYSARDQKYRSIAGQNSRFRELLQTAEAFNETYLLSNILTLDTDRFKRIAHIDKGTKDGVFEGQIALSGNSIYGQIIHSTPYSSIVMQLSDPKHTIPVRNSRTNDTALAVGTGEKNIVRLEHIKGLEKIKPNDLYVSSGLGLLFPADFPVAVVQKKEYNPADSMTTVTARTMTDFSRAREVLLIWQNNRSLHKDKK